MKSAAKRSDMHIVSIDTELVDLNNKVSESLERYLEEQEFIKIINNFLKKLPDSERDIFVRRYWYMDKIEDIAKRHYKKEATIKSSLFRTRKKLLKILQEEGRY